MTLEIEQRREFSPQLLTELADIYSRMDATTRSLFSDPAFMQACWVAFESDGEPMLLLGRCDGRLVGAAAFKYDTVRLTGLSVRCLVPVTYRVADFTDVLVEDDQREAFLDALVRELAGLNSYAMLPNMAESDVTTLRRLGGRMMGFSHATNPVCYDRDGQFGRIASKKRNRYYTNRLKRMGDLVVRHHVEGVSAEILQEYFDRHVERWAFDGIESKFVRTDLTDAYRRLCHPATAMSAAGNKIVFTEVALDERPVGLSVSYQWGQRLLYHVPTFNIEFMDFSPGQVLLREMFLYAVDAGLTCLDLGYGEESYKERFSSDRLDYHTFVLPPGRASSLGLRVRKTAARWTRMLGRSSGSACPPRSWRGLTIYRPGGSSQAVGADVTDLDFGHYVHFARQGDGAPLSLDRQVYRRFRRDGKLAAMIDGDRITAGIWKVEGTEVTLPAWDVRLAVDADHAVWLYKPIGSDETVRSLLSAMDAACDGAVFAVIEDTDHAEHRALASAGWSRCATVTCGASGPRLGDTSDDAVLPFIPARREDHADE